jgi:hypothetical protein
VTVQELLLTEERAAELTAALTNLGVTTPLETIIEEVEARLELMLGSFTVNSVILRQITRAFTLHHAYGLVGAVPKDIQKLYDEAVKLVTMVQTDAPLDTETAPAAYGSKTYMNPR